MRRLGLMMAVVMAVLVGFGGVVLATPSDEPPTVERVHHLLQGLQADFLIVGLEIRGIKNRMDEMEERVQALERGVAQGNPEVYEVELTCLIVSDGNALVPIGHELQPATIGAFSEHYGDRPGTATVSRVLLRPERGVLEVHYHMQTDMTLGGMITVVETWRGCEYVGAEFGGG